MSSKDLRALIEKLKKVLNVLCGNCPYQNEEVWVNNREIFISNIAKKYPFLCRNPERAYLCLKYLNEAKKLREEIEHSYPKDVDDAWIKYMEKRGFSREEIVSMKQASVIAKATERVYHYCDHIINTVREATRLVKVVEEYISR
ncbi:MAG: hypothetical protein QW511_05210 [Candidatus Methanomethylicia archaeon]